MAPSTSRESRHSKKPKRKPDNRTHIKTPEQILKSLHARLHHQIRDGFHRKALKTCNQLLNLPGSPKQTLIGTKAKLLTVLEQYQEALELLAQQPVESTALKLLESYCLYKLGNLDEASANCSNPVFSTQEDTSRGKIALESQILFKLGRYAEAKANLEELLVDAEPSHPEYVDITANLSACQARINFIDHYIPSQISSINVDQLESIPITSSFFHSQAQFLSSRPRPSKPLKQDGKLKTPKPLDPSRPPPDPDRWLPRREKEATRSKKRKDAANKKAKQKLATQGSVPPVAPSTTAPSHKPKLTQSKKKNKK